MNLQINGRYKTGNGVEWQILNKTERNSLGYFFIAERYVDGHVARFNADGYSNTGHQLLPNKVKKEGWIGLFHNPSTDRVSKVSGGYVFASKEEALKMQPHASCYTRIEWEEEET